MSVPQLGYWKIRGLAQPIRCFFDYVNQEYEDIFYVTGPAPEFSKDEWYSVKNTLGLDFPNLPYLIDGDTKISQSWAILKYVAHKWAPEALGKNLQDKIQAEQLQGVLQDFKMAVAGPQYQQSDTSVVEKIFVDRLKEISKYLAEKKYLVGDYLLENGSFVSKGKIFEVYPNLLNYHKRLGSQEQIQKHVLTNPTMNFQFNGPQALINN